MVTNKRTIYKLMLIVLLVSPTIGLAQQRIHLGQDYAKSELAEALKNKKDKQIIVGQIINDKATAISVAEPILFNTYGRAQIISGRPYEVYLINGYWVINGTLPKGMLGGTFLIILSSKDERVIKLTHYK